MTNVIQFLSFFSFFSFFSLRFLYTFPRTNAAAAKYNMVVRAWCFLTFSSSCSDWRHKTNKKNKQPKPNEKPNDETETARPAALVCVKTGTNANNKRRSDCNTNARRHTSTQPSTVVLFPVGKIGCLNI